MSDTELIPSMTDVLPPTRKEAKAADSQRKADARAARTPAIDYTQETVKPNPFSPWVEGTKRKKFKPNHKDKVIWLTTLSQQVSVGLTPKDALSTIGQDADLSRRRHRAPEASAFADEMMSRGYSFPDVMEMTGTLDSAAITALRAGHRGGELGATLRQSADRLERSYRIKSKIRGAMMMPLITLSLAALVGAYVLLKVVPTLGDVFSQLGGRLPLPTRILMAFSHALPYLLLAGIPAAVLTLLVYRALRRNPEYCIKIDRMKLRLPLVGDMLHHSALAGTFQTLGLLLSTGIVNSEALAVVAGSSKNEAIRDVFRRAGRTADEMGVKLHVFLSHEDLIPATDIALIKAGGKSGELSVGVAKSAEFHFVSAEELSSQFTDTITLVFTITVGLVVGVIALAIYLPMFQLYGLIGQNL